MVRVAGLGDPEKSLTFPADTIADSTGAETGAPDIDRRLFGIGVAAAGLSVAKASVAAQAIANTRPQDGFDLWSVVRGAFDLDQRYTNLSAGSSSPAPVAAQRRVVDTMAQVHSSPTLYFRLHEGADQQALKKRLARMIGAAPDEIVITRNATEGLMTVIFGLELKPGDEVITTSQDYATVIAAWKQREQREGIRVLVVNTPFKAANHQETVDIIRNAITPRTRVISVCHILSTSGQVMPVEEIASLAKSRGIELLVDAAHGLAQIPIDVERLGADYLMASLHKWLCAPHGAGVLYVRKSRIAKLWPLLASDTYEPRSENIAKLESIGTAPPVWVGAHAALDLHDAIGQSRRSSRMQWLKEYWAERLARINGVTIHSRLDPAYSCGMARFSVYGFDDLALARSFRLDHQLLVGATAPSANELYGGHPGVRGIAVDTPVFVSTDDLDRLVDTVKFVMRA